MGLSNFETDTRTLAIGGILALVVAGVLLSAGIGGTRPVGYPGPPIAASGLLIAVFALLGFE